jgi:hypothetical protein
MRRTVLGLCGAAVLPFLVASVGRAQSSTTATGAVLGRQLTVVGCLVQNGGRFMLKDARTLAGRSVVGTTGTTVRVPKGQDSWTLAEGGDYGLGLLAGHVNEQVEITGRIVTGNVEAPAQRADARLASAGGPAHHGTKLAVEWMGAISRMCP